MKMLQDNSRLQRHPLARLPELKSQTVAALAGVVGGSLSTLMLHPFDVLKTRQVACPQLCFVDIAQA